MGDSEVVHEIIDYPLPPMDFDDLPKEESESGADWDEPWRHFEGAFESLGYRIYWYHSPIPGVQDSPTCHDAENFPPPVNPFAPRDGEAIAEYPLGHYHIRMSWRERNVHPAYDRFGRRVVIKAVKAESSEFSIVKYLSCQRRVNPDPRDHTIPFLDIIKIGKFGFLVMPEWKTRVWPYNVGEYVEWFEQCLEGLSYMHEHLIAFRDVSKGNILWNYGGDYGEVDGAPFASLFNAKYGYIDFGQSTRFPPDTPPHRRKVTGTVHTPDTAPPELSDTEEYDPFAVDVFALGRYIQLQLENEQDQPSNVSPVPALLCRSMPGLVDILSRMTNTDPSKRPSASQALSKLRELVLQTPKEVLQAPGCQWFWGLLPKPGNCCPEEDCDKGRFWRWRDVAQ